MSTSPAYLLGRVTGLLARPLLPFAESALAGVLDGLFGEPDAMDDYTPIPEPNTKAIYTPIRWTKPSSFDEGAYIPPDPTWTLPEERLSEIRGDAA